MSRNRIVVLAILLVFAGGFAYFRFLSPTARVKRALFQAREAVEKQDMAAISAIMADDFRDGFGFTKEQWLPIIQASMDSWKDINLRFLDLRIEIKGDQATTKFHANGEATRASSLGQNLPDRQAYTFQNITLQWARRDGVWRVVGWTNINSQTWQVPMPDVGQ